MKFSYVQGLQALLQFCWAMTLSGLRVGGILTPDTCSTLEEDETFMDLALGTKYSLGDSLIFVLQSSPSWKYIFLKISKSI